MTVYTLPHSVSSHLSLRFSGSDGPRGDGVEVNVPSFLAVWTYYTFRATAFRFVYLVIYQFLPVMVAVKLFELPLKRVLARSVARGG